MIRVDPAGGWGKLSPQDEIDKNQGYKGGGRGIINI